MLQVTISTQRNVFTSMSSSQDGRAGEACELPNKIMLFLPPQYSLPYISRDFLFHLLFYYTFLLISVSKYVLLMSAVSPVTQMVCVGTVN